jgi:hypothetical protein
MHSTAGYIRIGGLLSAMNETYVLDGDLGLRARFQFWDAEWLKRHSSQDWL